MVNQCKTRYGTGSCIEHKGKTLTVREWAKEIGMHCNSLLYRLNSGMSIESAIETPININRQKGRRLSSKKYEYNGKLYTISELSEMSGISGDTLSSRISNGWSIKSAIETPVFSPKLYEYNGKKYTLRELAKEVGILHRTLKTRLDRNWTLEEAIGVKARTHMSNKQENKEMLSTDVKVDLNKDNTYNIPVVWNSKEDEIVKKGIRESIPSSTLYQMLDGKHSVDSIELRKSILLKTMGMEYSSLVNEKQEYTMRDIIIHIYPTIDCTFTQGKEYVRARGRVMCIMKSLGLYKHTTKKNTSEIYHTLTRAELNKIRIEIDKKFPEGIKCVTLGKQKSSDSKEIVYCTMESPVIDKAEPNLVANIETDQPKQQLSSIQQYYRTQIKQFNEFISKLQQSDNTKFKLVNVHCSDNSVKLWVEWE